MIGLTEDELREWDALLCEIQRNPNHQQRMLSQVGRKLLALDLEERLRVAKIRAAGLARKPTRKSDIERKAFDDGLTEKQREIREKLKRLKGSVAVD